MQVQQLPIYQFLEGQNKIFSIPVYQRDYAWTRLNCQKLWEDIVDLNKNKRFDHFLGTIVTIGSGYQEYTVIDGQQRLTTVSLMILALHKYLFHKIDRTQDESIILEQSLEFLINKYTADQQKRIRLKPNKQDKLHFESLFSDQVEIDIDSNIINNYNFFYKKISTEELSARQLIDTLQKLTIVLINLERGTDNPQLIFESLNSTGVDLTAGDLIRNYMLMDLPSDSQEYMYNKFWLSIEEKTQNVPEFIRNYLIYQNRISIKRDDVYSVFKKFATSVHNNDRDAIAKELIYFAKIYSVLRQISSVKDISQNVSIEIDYQLKRLNKLEFSVSYPYLFDIFDDLLKGNLSDNTITEILKILESYAFRKILVDNSTQGFNKMFITLSKEIKKEKTWKNDYLEIFKFIITQKTASQRFPKDEEFKNALIYKEIYRLQSKNKNFLLESLENYKSGYVVDIENLSIEHIMPQTLNHKWRKQLGNDCDLIHRKYLHTLGNLSLTAHNSKLSNKSLAQKQEEDFKLSKLALNFQLDNISEWNEATILERAERLAKKALLIWPYPSTTYTKSVKQEQRFDLTSDDDFAGSKPLVLFIEDQEIPLKSWRNLLSHICKTLYEYSPTQFMDIQKKAEFQWYFNVNKPLKSPIEFLPHKFIEGNVSANMVTSLVLRLCEEMGYPSENISFSVKFLNDSRP